MREDKDQCATDLLSRFPSGMPVDVPPYMREHGGPEPFERWNVVHKQRRNIVRQQPHTATKTHEVNEMSALRELKKMALWEPGHRNDEDDIPEGEGSLIPGLEERRGSVTSNFDTGVGIPFGGTSDTETPEGKSELPGDELSARFEEGKPADPCKNMTEGECQKWKAQNAKYRNKFKNAMDELEGMAHVAEKKWIQKAIERPGALHRHFGIPEDQKIPSEKLRAEQKKLRDKKERTPAESKLLKQINMAITLRSKEVPPPKGKKALDELEKLSEEKWIQKAIERPGALHRHFGIPEDQKIPTEKIRAEKKKLDDKEERTPAESKLLKQLNLALTLRSKEVPPPGGKKAAVWRDSLGVKIPKGARLDPVVGALTQEDLLKGAQSLKRMAARATGAEGIAKEAAAYMLERLAAGDNKRKAISQWDASMDIRSIGAQTERMKGKGGLILDHTLKTLKNMFKKSSRDRITHRKESRIYTGLYGLPKKVQSDCQSAAKRLSTAAINAAKKAYSKDERVAAFLNTHAERSGSLSAQILVNAMKKLGPKIAAEGRKQARLEELREKKAGKAKYGLYGYKLRTAKLGIEACNSLRNEAGVICVDLHRRRSDKHSQITAFLKDHSKTGKCLYSKMLSRSYPSVEMKLASSKPRNVSEWLSWED